MLARAENSALVVVDVQPKFLAPIFEADRVLRRTEFMLKAARLADVPIFATEQYPDRMGHTDERLSEFIDNVEGKMRFSCLGCSGLRPWLESSSRRQVVLVGIETHICVNQTAHDLHSLGYDPIVVEDAVSARTPAMSQNGLFRMRAIGVTIAHSESIAYEWFGGADHPRFKELLQLVKDSS